MRYFRPIYLIIVLLFFATAKGLAQDRTVGVFQLETDAEEGYTLFSPSVNKSVYLIDNCGRLAHSWNCAAKPGNAVYLQPDGSLYRAGQLNNLKIHAGGAGGLIERYDWGNQLLWTFEYNTPTYRAHHDFQVLPNGNVLILAWEVKDLESCMANGRDTSILSNQKLWPEHIIEVAPIGLDSGTIVWEWHAWDHLIQDHDATKANFGVVSEHPEKIDINYIRPNKTGADWQHANSIHYNVALDQILISVLFFDEIWIIDHNTTREEAAGTKGDLLFRWGNPQAYQQGDETDKKLFGQHSAHWIADGLPDAGKILIFNNGAERTDSLYSSVVKINPTFENGQYDKGSNGRFLPTDFDWEYQANPPTSFYSRFISGAQQLANGNILITDGAHGTFIEINSANEVVWKYVNPLTIFGTATQGNIVVNPNGEGTNTVFRAIKFPIESPIFEDKNLSPNIPIELNPNLAPCMLTSIPSINTSTIEIFPNPVVHQINIKGYTGAFQLFDLVGKIKLSGQIEQGAIVDVNFLPSGIYFLQLGTALKKIIIQQ